MALEMKLKKGNGLNSWFNAFLGLNIIYSGGGLIVSLVNMIKEIDNGCSLYVLGSICAVCITIVGSYWLLKAEKVGFYLFVAGCLMNAAIAYIQYCDVNAEEWWTIRSVVRGMAFRGVWLRIGKVVFVMLLMLLRCDGKNVYQRLKM